MKDYIEKSRLVKANKDLNWMDYGGYVEYPQISDPFVHGVSIIDTIFSSEENLRELVFSKF